MCCDLYKILNGQQGNICRLQDSKDFIAICTDTMYMHIGDSGLKIYIQMYNKLN